MERPAVNKKVADAPSWDWHYVGPLGRCSGSIDAKCPADVVARIFRSRRAPSALKDVLTENREDLERAAARAVDKFTHGVGDGRLCVERQ